AGRLGARRAPPGPTEEAEPARGLLGSAGHERRSVALAEAIHGNEARRDWALPRGWRHGVPGRSRAPVRDRASGWGVSAGDDLQIRRGGRAGHGGGARWAAAAAALGAQSGAARYARRSPGRAVLPGPGIELLEQAGQSS